MSRSDFTMEVMALIRAIPEGRVCTYGRIAALAGNPRAARQVARILHTFSELEALPWHRVVNREGGISLRPLDGYEEQRLFLEEEGVTFDPAGGIDLDRYLWAPDSN